jgi:hypothetical protein
VLERSGSSLGRRGTVTGLRNAWGVAVSGTTVYVADAAAAELVVIDASNPDAPRVAGRVATGGAPTSVEVDGATAFVAASKAGLVVVDVANPAAPSVIGRGETPGRALQVALGGGRAYLADWNDARVFDVSDPTAPRAVASQRLETGDVFSRVLGIGAREDIAFLGEWTGLYSYQFFPDRPAPDLFVSERRIDFGGVAPGGADAFALIVENTGTAPLVAWSIATAGAAFSADPASLWLQPGERSVIEVTYQPSGTAGDDGTLVIQSDDPDDAMRAVPIAGNVPGAGPGDPAPEVRVRLLGGGEWVSSQQAGKVLVLAYFATF